MDFKKVVQNMQKIQRNYDKEKKVLDEQEFSYTVSNALKLTLKGNMELVSLEILDDSLLSVDNKEMLIDMITLAYTNVREQVFKADDELTDKYQNQNALGKMI